MLAQGPYPRPRMQNQANQPGMDRPNPIGPVAPGLSSAPMPTMPESVMPSPPQSMTSGGNPASQMQTAPGGMGTQQVRANAPVPGAPAFNPAAGQQPIMGAPSQGIRGKYGADNAPPGGIRPPAGNGNPAWGRQDGVSPFNAASGATGIGDFQRFSDNAYNESTRRMDPQFASQQKGFEQDMVNRGIAPGTEAYDNARQNFDQAKSDAYAGARAQADQMGLAAQQQSFGQGQASSALLNQLLQAQMGADASRYGADASANASMSNANTMAGTQRDRLGFDQQQGDFSNLMQMLGFGAGINGQNNSAAGQNNNAWNQTGQQNYQLTGMGGQYGQPGNIDTQTPYNNQYNGQMNQANYNQQQNNANNQMYAQMFASMMCDRDAKISHGPAPAQDALDAIASIPYECWTYKADEARAPHVGTYAQDFNKALGLPEAKVIEVIDLLGALIGSVQALTAKVKGLEAA